MSAETMKRPRSAAPGAAGGGKLSFAGVLRSEFIKFFSLPSTLILVLTTFVLMVGIAALGVWGVGASLQTMADQPEMAAQMGDLTVLTASLPGSGMIFAQLVIGALAVMVMSSEFATGSARSTFVATPTRQPVLWAKALMVAVVSALVALASLLAAFVVARPIAENYGLPLDFASEVYQRNLWFGVLYVVMVSLIGLALGTLLRNSAGGIVVLAALFFVLPIAVDGLSGFVSWLADAARFLPDHAGNALMQVPGAEGALQPWASGLVVGAWIVVPLVAAAMLLQRRDI